MPNKIRYHKSMSAEQSFNLRSGYDNLAREFSLPQPVAYVKNQNNDGQLREYVSVCMFSILGTNGIVYSGIMRSEVPVGGDLVRDQNKVILEFILGDEEPSLHLEQRVVKLGFVKEEKPKTHEKSRKPNPIIVDEPTILHFPVRNR